MAQYLATTEKAGTGAVMTVQIDFKGVDPSVGSGSTPYINPNDIKAVVVTPATETTAEVSTAIGVTYIGPTTFRTNTVVPVGKILRVYRETQDEYGLVNFQALQNVTELDLDLNTRQMLYVSMETRDAASRAVEVAKFGDTLSRNALQTSRNATTTALGAVATAEQAQSRAGQAVLSANEANRVAGQAVQTSQSALAGVTDAVTAADEATAAAVKATADAAAAIVEAKEYADNATARFLGPKAVAPTKRDNGDSLEIGDRYLNTASGIEFIFTSGGWAANNVDGADIANKEDPGKGATLVGFDQTSVAQQLQQARKISSYDDLRAYTGNASRVEVTADGLSGLFVKTSEADDGGVYVGGWRRQFVGEVQASWFGMSPLAPPAVNTAALRAAVLACARFGGGIVSISFGTYALDSAGITLPVNVKIKGQGKKSTSLLVAASETTVLFDVPPPSTTYNECGVTDLEIYNSSMVSGLAAIRTAEVSAGFLNAQKYDWRGLGFRGYGWKRYISQGDASQVAVDWAEARGRYQPGSSDVGQDDNIFLFLNGVRGVVRVDINNWASIGVRRGIVIGEYVEGIWATRGEITNCWSGITSITQTSKPGGFIDNMHISANKECINLLARRDLQIGVVQCYRSTGMHTHGTGWVGLALNGCARITVESLEIRNGVADAGEQIGFQVNNGDTVVVDKIIFAESGAITHAVDIKASAVSSKVRVKNVTLDGVANWVRLGGTLNNCVVENVDSSTVPASPFSIVGAGVDKATCRWPTISCVDRYSEATYNTARTLSWAPYVNPKHQKISITAAINVDLTLDHTLAMKGDKYNLRLTIIAVAGRLRIFSSANSATPLLTIDGSTAANTLRKIKLVSNGGGWVIDEHYPLLN